MYYVLGTLNYNSGKYRVQDGKKRVFLITLHYSAHSVSKLQFYLSAGLVAPSGGSALPQYR